MAITKRETETVTVHIEVSLQTLRDLLCTAVEGGSTYWARFSVAEADRTEHLDYLRVKVTELEASRADVHRINRYVSAEDLAQGIRRLAEAAAKDDGSFPAAAMHLARALSDHDATTADVVLQMAVFGEVIYG